MGVAEFEFDALLTDHVSAPAKAGADALEGLGDEVEKTKKKLKEFDAAGKLLDALGRSSGLQSLFRGFKEGAGVGASIAGFEMIANVATEIVSKVIDITEGLVEGALAAADLHGNLAEAMGLIEASPEAVGETYESIEKMSSAMGVTSAEALKAYMHFRNLGFAAEDAKNLMAGGADLGKIAGEGAAAGLDRMLATVDKIDRSVQGGGKLTARVLGSLTPMGISVDAVAEELAKSKGISDEAAKAAMKSKGVSEGELLTAMLDAIKTHAKEGDLGAFAMKTADKSIGSAANEFKNTLESVGAQAAGPAKDALVDAIHQATAVVSSDEVKGNIKAVFADITDMIKMITDTKGGTQDSMLSKAIKDAVVFVKELVALTKSWFGILGGVLDVVHGIVGAFGAVTIAAAKAREIAANPGDRPKGPIGTAVGQAIDQVHAAIGTNATSNAASAGTSAQAPDVGGGQMKREPIGWSAVLADAPTVEQVTAQVGPQALGEALPKGMAEGVRSGSGTLYDALHDMVEEMKSRTKADLAIHSPSRVFADMGLNVGLGMAEGIDDGSDHVDRAMGRMMNIPGGASVSAGGGRSGGGGGATLHMGGVTIQVRGGGNASELAEQVADILESRMADGWERITLEAGSADLPSIPTAGGT